MPWIRSSVTAVAVALALMGAGSANAASTTSDAAFERQVRDNLAANPGSERVGPNQIRLEPGLTLTLHRRSATAAHARGPCNWGYFCIYEKRDWYGAALAMSACKTYILHSYRFKDEFDRWDRWDLEASSWFNNQKFGAAATLWHLNGNTFKAPIGHDAYLNPPWNDRVVRVRPC